MPLYTFLHNLWNVLVHTANEMGLKKCLWPGMGVKLGLWLLREEQRLWYLRTECWGECLEKRIMKCVQRRFGGKYHFHLQDKINLATCCTPISCSADFRPWRWKLYLPPKGKLYRTKRSVISEDGNIRNYRCEALRAYTKQIPSQGQWEETVSLRRVHTLCLRIPTFLYKQY
jgi:hypothetical protein